MMNLHDIVRPIIPILHPDEDVLLIQSTGGENVRGVITPNYADPQLVIAQIQSMGSDELQAQNDVSVAGEQRKAWLYSDTVPGITPDGIYRPMARGGDLIRRADGTWWYVAGLQEDFTASGWVSVHIAEQITVPPTVLDLAAEFDAEHGQDSSESGTDVHENDDSGNDDPNAGGNVP